MLKGLLIKEWFQIRHSLKRFLGIIVILGIIFGSSGDSISLLWIIEFLCFSSIITTLNLDERTKWDSYERVLAMSIEKKVVSKYIFMILCNLFGTLLGCTISIIISPEECILILGSAFFINILLMVIGIVMLPLLYKFGTERMRVINIAIVLILFYGISIVTEQLAGSNLFNIILVGFPVIGVIAIFISIKISKKIYQYKQL